jgi:hypothetical protein
MYGRGERCTGFWGGSLKERDHFQDLGIRGDNIKILKKHNAIVSWINLAQAREK